jgi:hypothetical protein
MIPAGRRASVFLTLLLSSCTPLGLWLYEDPVITVSRITLELGKPARVKPPPVVVALDVKNVNDYPLSAERLELSLRVDGIAVGKLKHDSTVAVATESISTLAVAMPVERWVISDRLEASRSVSHFVAVQGRAIFRTPIGIRKVRFAQSGAMIFSERPTGSTP